MSGIDLRWADEATQHYPLPHDSLVTGWVAARVRDIAHEIGPGFASGEHTSSRLGVPHMRPMNISRDGAIDLSLVKSVPNSRGVSLRTQDVLFNNTNSPELVGKTALVGQSAAGFAYSNHMTRINVVEGVVPGYVAAQLHFLWMSGYFRHRCANHVNQASISTRMLADSVPLLVAPRHEQVRIVDKLEELLSDLDAGVAELRAAQAKLKLYRQSLLKAAVTGELTVARRKQRSAPGETGSQLLARVLIERRKRWEVRQLERFAEQGKQPPNGWQGKYPEPVALEDAGLPALPPGWTWASLDQLCPDDIANGRSVPTATEGPLVLRLTAVREGRIDLAECKAGTWTREDARPYFVEDGDLLIVRGNGSLRLVGRAGLVTSPDREVAYPDTLIRVRVVSTVVSPEWVALAWDSAFVRTHLEGRARTSAGIYKISQPDILSAPIAVPPAAEQTFALELFEEALSTTVDAEASLRTALLQSEAQRKNILQAAFSGRLVPQDPSDEPASALLERIRASRADKASVPSRRPRKAKEPA